MKNREIWPALPFPEWKDTAATLQLWTQIVGKVRLTLTPWINHSWHVTLYLTARGLTTSPIPCGRDIFEMGAVTRFSGRAAPPHPGGVPHLPNAVAREAYSHEVSSCGFWPGSEAMPEPVFYSYALPGAGRIRRSASGTGRGGLEPGLCASLFCRTRK